MMNTPAWIVKEVLPRTNYSLLLTFVDGSQRIYDAQPLLRKAIFAELNSLQFFLQAHVSGDTVIWNDDVDIAPEHLYECSVPVK